MFCVCFVVRCSLLVVRCSLSVARDSLFDVWFLMFGVCCLALVVCCFWCLLVVGCLLFVCELFDVSCWLSVVRLFGYWVVGLLGRMAVGCWLLMVGCWVVVLLRCCVVVLFVVGC